MSMKDRTKGLAAALKLDSHHQIERFGVIFVALATSFVLLFSSASASSFVNQAEKLDSTTIYTPTFSTSRTQQSGEVLGVYTNTERTRALVMMQFKSARSMSANADKYQGFITGSTRDQMQQQIKTDVSGEIVVFGSTGYIGMILDSNEPFEQQILNLTMRSNSELVYRKEQSRQVKEDLAGQKSFTEFDQWRIYFNPGAKDAQELEALNASSFDPGAVYAELVVAPQEKEAKTKLDEQLAQMQVDLARIAEYEGEAKRVNVDGVFLEVPEVPEQIAGDEVTGKPALDDTASTLELKTQWVSPRGFDFDWRAGSVKEGFLDKLVPGKQSYVDWLAAKAAAERGGNSGVLNPAAFEWTLSNGLLLKDYSQSDTAMKPLFDIRNELAQAYQDYYKHKVAYQVDAHTKLIELDINLRNVREGSSTNATDDALFVY